MLSVASPSRLLRHHYSRNPLQVRYEMHIAPLRQQLLGPCRLRVAKFHQQPSTRFQNAMRLLNQPREDLCAFLPAEDGDVWLVFADLRLDFIRFQFPDVRWIGNYDVGPIAAASAEQIGDMKMNAMIKQEARSIRLRDLERIGRDINRMNFSSRQLIGKRQRNTS